MKDLFVPYEIAVQLKELGFNERCFGFYELEKLVISTWRMNVNSCLEIDFEEGKPRITAPTFSQAFRFFRDKCEIYYTIEGSKKFEFQHFIYDEKESYEIKSEETFKDYEEAELACLNKLIEIVKNK